MNIIKAKGIKKLISFLYIEKYNDYVKGYSVETSEQKEVKKGSIFQKFNNLKNLMFYGILYIK